MGGEYGTRIHDDIRMNVALTDDQNRQSLSATIYGDATYRLQVQFDCGGQLDGNPSGSPCSQFLSVSIWIDFNDNGIDDGESRALDRAWASNDKADGNYDLVIRIPAIDGAKTKSGLHRTRLSVTASEEYQRECGAVDYKETRFYTLNVVPRLRYLSKYRPVGHDSKRLS